MTDRFAAAVESAAASLRAHADAAAAPIRKRYLKSPHEVLGCGVPVVNAAARAVKRAHRDPEPEALIAALGRLRASPVHDDRLLAMVLAGLYWARFRAAHLAEVFRPWLADCRTWDLVDGIATRAAGRIALGEPAGWDEIESWAGDPWMWLRRASLLSHIPAIRAGALDGERLRRTCGRLIDEREFFIRKAIGWALRELSLRDLETAEALVLELAPRASALTLREATRRMPAERRRRILETLGGS